MSGFDPGKVPLDIRGRDNFDNYVQWLISQGFPFHLRKSMLFGQARAVGLTVDYEVARRVLPEERAAHPHAERRFK